MRELSIKEKDLLYRIENKPELQPFFFRKAKGLHWFDLLSERGFFSPEKNPKPIPAKEEGYVSIPYWSATDYLVKTSEELGSEENQEYASKFLNILKEVTQYAVGYDISNYRTWWRFSEIIQNIPSVLIELNDIEMVKYWLKDKFERGLVAQEIGKKWTRQLLESNDDRSLQLALRLLSYLFKVDVNERQIVKTVHREPSFRFDY